MPDFLSPEVVTRERASSAVAFREAPSATTFMEATAKRGPVNRLVSIFSPDEYRAIYDEDDAGDGFQSMIGFFTNAGAGAELVMNRVAHYTDITDPTTLTATAAETEVNTGGAAATAASKLSAEGPWDLSAANGVAYPPTLIVSIDGDPADTAQLSATPSVLTAAGVPGGIGTPGDTLIFSINGVSHTYTVPGSPPTTATEWALSISAQLPGVFGGVSAGAVQLTTDRRGSGADVDYTSGTGSAGVDSGFGAGPTAGVNAGPNDVVRLDDVTAAELEPVIEADWTGGGGVTATVTGAALLVETVATGASASIGVVSGTAASVVDFDPAGVASGVAAGGPSLATFNVFATSEGEHGNGLACTVSRQDRVIAQITEDIAAAPTSSVQVDVNSQFRVGLQIFIEDSVTTGTLRAVVSRIVGTTVFFETAVTPTAAIEVANNPTVTKETFTYQEIVDGEVENSWTDLSMSPTDVKFYFETVIGSDPELMDPRRRTYVEDLEIGYSNTQDPRPLDATLQSLSGGTDSDPLVDNDYIGSDSSDLGLYAADNNDRFSISIIPGIETSAVHNALLDYASSREDHVCILEAPEGFTPAQVVTYKNTTANLFGTYGIMYAGRPKVLRQSTGLVEDFPAGGYVAGMYVRCDRENNVSEPPAGPRKGQLRGVLGAANNNLYQNKSNRDLLYPEGINTIFSRPGSGVLAWGQLTLDPTSDRGSIGVRRAFIHLRKRIRRLAEFVIFEINTPQLRGRFRNLMTSFFREQRRLGVVKGETDSESFYIVCDESNNPPSVVNARKFFARLGANVLPGIDFATIDLERDTRSLDQELASAA